ncbi:hypothetical protein B296_00027374, partial [Ensete ventricosum]
PRGHGIIEVAIPAAIRRKVQGREAVGSRTYCLIGSKEVFPLDAYSQELMRLGESTWLEELTSPWTHNSNLFYRGRSSPAVSKSVNVLDLSGMDKSAKPTRRLSIPTKTAHPPTVKSMTPISEARARISNIQGKSDTPLSDISKSMSKRKFNVLSSVSYWLTQIKLSESASWHSISLGFFKLALESGCEDVTIEETSCAEEIQVN